MTFIPSSRDHKNLPYPSVLITHEQSARNELPSLKQEEKKNFVPPGEKITNSTPPEMKNVPADNNSLNQVLVSQSIPMKKEENSTCKSFVEEKKKVEEQLDPTNVNFSLFQYVFSNLCSLCIKTKNSMKLKNLQKTYLKQIDILKILTKLQDVEKLKKILLDQDQLEIFNFLGKPILEVEEKVKNKKIIMKREAKKKRFIECYQRMLARMNDVDTRLFLLAEENIEN